MSTPKRNEQTRRMIVQHLMSINAEFEAIRLDTEKRINEVKVALERCEQPLPEGNFCPDCWFYYGIYSVMKPQSVDAKHRCDRCGFIDEQQP